MTAPTARSTEVSPDQLEAIAAETGAAIVLPGNRSGWARVRHQNRRWHAWVNAPAAKTKTKEVAR